MLRGSSDAGETGAAVVVGAFGEGSLIVGEHGTEPKELFDMASRTLVLRVVAFL